MRGLKFLLFWLVVGLPVSAIALVIGLLFHWSIVAIGITIVLIEIATVLSGALCTAASKAEL